MNVESELAPLHHEASWEKAMSARRSLVSATMAPMVGRCKLNPGSKAPPGFNKKFSNLIEDELALNLNLVSELALLRNGPAAGKHSNR